MCMKGPEQNIQIYVFLGIHKEKCINSQHGKLLMLKGKKRKEKKDNINS